MNTIGLFLLLAGLSPLPAIIAAIRKLRNNGTAFSMVLLGLSLITTIVEWLVLAFASSSFNQPFIVDDVTKGLDMALVMNGLFCAIVVFVNIVLLLIVLFAKRHNMRKFFVWMLFLFLATLLVVAIIGSVVTGRSIDECFFGACCGWLYVVGLLLGFTYKEICVIVNIYLESFLCLLSVLWVTWITIRRFIRTRTVGNGVLMAGGIVYGIAGFLLFLWTCNHYAMPMNDAFDLCYRELVQLAKEYHTTYSNVNYVIFIIFFLVCTLGNMGLAWLINRIAYRNKEQ